MPQTGASQLKWNLWKKPPLVTRCMAIVYVIKFSCQDFYSIPVDPEDYTGFTLTFLLTSTMTSACFNVTVVPDDLFEMDETFLIELSSTDPSAVLNPDEARIRIVDDDSMPCFRN